MPFLHMMVAANYEDLEAWAFKDFGTDREGIPRVSWRSC